MQQIIEIFFVQLDCFEFSCMEFNSLEQLFFFDLDRMKYHLSFIERFVGLDEEEDKMV